MAFNPNDPYGAQAKNNKVSGIKTLPPPSPYGGFWLRLGALLLDMLIFALLIVAVILLKNQFRFFQVYYLPFGYAIGLFYGVFLVKKYGGTPGKLIMGLRIMRVDGTPIGYREAVLRYLPGFVLGVFSSAALIMALLQMSDAEFAALSFGKRSVAIQKLEPSWAAVVHVLQQVWTWSELVILLTNKKKRALHDFVAGTVVMKKSALPPALPATIVPAGKFL